MTTMINPNIHAAIIDYHRKCGYGYYLTDKETYLSKIIGHQTLLTLEILCNRLATAPQNAYYD